LNCDTELEGERERGEVVDSDAKIERKGGRGVSSNTFAILRSGGCS